MGNVQDFGNSKVRRMHTTPDFDKLQHLLNALDKPCRRTPAAGGDRPPLQVG